MDTTNPPAVVAVGDLLKAYDARQRAAASAAGRPRKRMASAVVPQVFDLDASSKAADHYAWTGDDGQVVLCRDPQGRTRKVASTADAVAIIGPHSRLVLDDRATAKRLARLLAKRDAGVEIAGARRVLALCTSLPSAPHLVVLTEALRHKMWLPGDDPGRTFDVWANAYGIAGDPVPEAMTRLLAVVTDGTHSPHLQAIARTEAFAVNSAVYGGLSNACSTYAGAEFITDQWAALCAADVRLRDRGVLDGSVALATPIPNSGTQMRARLSKPFKLKVGRDVTLSLDTAQGNSTLVDLEVDGEDLIGVFTLPSRRTRKSGFILEAARTGQPLYVTAKPFTGGARRGGGKRRWASREPAQWTRREVPLDVSLAATS
ncbi:hypothetical protein [Isoptericola croceus]|uniref:hypothetical protein n=1 Tax=Isoptericola croceus TaxID=3031406 RepID=UPI0023F6E2C7|nr:hypothetical protein [Isoptericola croceus]